ncbi:MAG: hypothetical protein M1827_006925 [Pycnora praestabilis]|nr:MAG: hypothetical protein M1827_006925 [Pycnora praestabilis]
MTLKDLLKKRDKIKDNDAPAPETPEFTFMRTTTTTQEIIVPPSFAGDENASPLPHHDSNHHHKSRFRRSSSAASISSYTSNPPSTSATTEKGERRLSQRLHLTSRSRTTSASSVNLPQDLPIISDEGVEKGEGRDGAIEREARWEERATLLARGTTISHNNERPPSPQEQGRYGAVPETVVPPRPAFGRNRTVSVGDAKGDVCLLLAVVELEGGIGAASCGQDDIQVAIRLHEAGDLERSTAMFGRLADPTGANNPLSQVLYGLALRHGWGTPPNPTLAINYLSAAATNSAAIESAALSSGLKKGGAAKGELVLAIFELANCFRHGWGVGKDETAARQYYETAANLGDVDGMNEVARCFEEGVGGGKDRFAAAKYYRLAEEKGSKTLGNSW